MEGGPIATGGIKDGLVGRDEERAQLRDAISQTGNGGPRALAIRGEPGIGKTRLLAELTELAEGAGAVTLPGRAAQFEREVPFGLFVDALDGFLASQSPRRLEPLGGGRLTDLARIFPALAELGAPGGGVTQAERHRAHNAVGALLDLLARPRPLVLALDDLQWADEASLELASHLLRRPGKGRKLLALAYRPGEAPALLSEAVDVAVREHRLDPLELGPLSEAEVAELLSDSVDPEAGSRLYRDSGGNPFYLDQLRRALEPGAGAGAAGIEEQHGPGGQVPPAVAAALAGELAALDSDARALLDGASVAGDPFSLELALRAAGLGDAEGRAALDELLTRELVRPTEVPRRFGFRHPVVRRAVYAAAKHGWRLGAHARVRDALTEQGAAPTELAHHVEQAANPGDAEAVAVLERAGHAAADLGPGPAAHWFGAALRLLPEGETARRLELLVPMATALAASGRMEESRAPLVEAIELLPAEAEETRVGLTALLAGVDHLLGHHDEAAALLRTAHDELPDPSSPAAISLQIEMSSDANYASDFETARHWGNRALAGAEAGGFTVLQAGAAAALSLACLFPDRLAEAERHRALAARLVGSIDDEELAGYLPAAWSLVHAELFLERYQEAVSLAERVQSISRSTGQGQFLVSMLVTGAWGLGNLGRAAEAIDWVEAGIEAARVGGNAQGRNWGEWVRSWIAGSVGDFEAAVEFGEASLETADGLDDNIVAIAGYAHFGCVCTEIGDHDRCLELMERAGAPDFPRFYADRRPHLWEALTRAALARGDEAEAEGWVGRSESFIEGLDLPLATGAARRARARLLLALDSPAEAAEFALAAAEAQQSRGARIEVARSRVLAGQALASAGRRDDAIGELETAHTDLDACGAARYCDEAARELRRLGRTVPRVAPRKSATEGVEALSGREREIATLAAEARTNREIAATLYISEKTVEKHLTKVFAKLGVKGRAAIGAELVARGDDLRPRQTAER